MTADSPTPQFALTDEDIADYLQQHPNFFVNRSSLLADLRLPHDSGSAISLVERQVGVLRERNQEMNHRLETLLDNARANDKLFEKTKRLILSLLEAQDINDLLDALLYSFKHDFSIEYTAFILFDEHLSDQRVLATNESIQLLPLATGQQVLGTIISNNQTVCGQLDEPEQALVFRELASSVGSTAIAPLASGRPLGVLAIGHSDPEYYRSSMSTLFLSYIGEVLSRLLPQHLA